MTDVYLKSNLNKSLELIEDNGGVLVLANTRRARGSDPSTPFSVPRSMVVGRLTRNKILARRKRGKTRDERNDRITRQWGNHCG